VAIYKQPKLPKTTVNMQSFSKQLGGLKGFSEKIVDQNDIEIKSICNDNHI